MTNIPTGTWYLQCDFPFPKMGDVSFQEGIYNLDIIPNY